MSIPEDQLAALEAEVAAVLGILEVFEDDGVAEGIRRYADQLERIGSVAGGVGILGLQDVCLLFQENLMSSGIRNRDLSDTERERLEEWPMLVIGYLMSPSDPQAGEALLDHLRSPVWNTSLPEQEADVLRGLLVFDLSATETAPPVTEFEETATAPEMAAAADEQSTVSAEQIEALEMPPPILRAELAASAPAIDWAESTAPENIPTQEPEPPAIPPAAITAAIPPVAMPITEPDATAIISVEPTSPPAVEDMIPTTTESQPGTRDTATEYRATEFPSSAVDAASANATESFEKWSPTSVMEPASETAPTTVEETPEIVASVTVEEPSSSTLATEEEPAEEEPAEEEPAEEESAEEEPEEEPEEESADEEPEEKPEEEPEEAFESTAANTTPSAAQQEMLEILCAEIDQIAESADDILTMAADGASIIRGEALSDYAERLELLANASASIGLAGLQQICTRLRDNLKALSAQSNPLNTEQRRVVEAWPGLALDYLRALDDRTVCATLAYHLQDTHWPAPLETEEAVSLIDLLAAPKLVNEETEAEIRPQQAQPEDVSLVLPADVNPQLLDSLLQELPHQAAEFSTAIQRLAAGNGNLKDVEVAQRIAHTLKGAGNTVGVRGIATLTHHVEDILQALSKHGALPSRPLANTLLNASDCLEIMSEALLGVSTPPSQALAVLQEVLDWANRIDQSGIPADDEIPLSTTDQPAPSERPEAAPTTLQPASSTPEVTLRIPANLVDDLLRLVGESIILTGQVQERARKTIAQTKAMLGQNRSLQQLTAELEQLVDVRNVSSPLSKSIQRGDFDPLELEQYNELNTITHRLVEAAADAREINRAIEDNLTALDSLLVDQSRLHRNSQEAVLRTRMVPIQTVVPRLQRSVRQTCRLVNKEAELVMRGADTLVDSNVLNGLVDPLMHILRNAVDHGIESPEHRKRSGKPPMGQIELTFVREGNNIVIRCQDDGAGLDLVAIRRAAEERGLLSSDRPHEEDELARLILLPGFSTYGKTTQTSGRGIGMDMVYSRLLDMKGSLRIQTKAGQGCLIELRLPVTLISTHALLLHMRNQVYALSDRGIEQILYFGVGKIQTVGNTTTYRLGNDIHELTSLESLLNLPPDRREQGRATPPVLLVREEKGTLRAVLVEEIVDSRDLVVKNLGHYIPKLEGVVGATILGDGSVAPVLDLPELLRSHDTGYRLPTTARATERAESMTHRQIVLVVDDSLSARRSLAQFVQDADFEVRTARDGLEAIEVINSKKPDLILADLEMPRMNGLELTAHLRANSATHDIPVVMITSRSTDKHRREAETIGVNAYLTKPFVEDDLLEHIHKLLSPA